MLMKYINPATVRKAMLGSVFLDTFFMQFNFVFTWLFAETSEGVEA